MKVNLFFYITEKRKQVSHKSDLKDCQEHLRHKKTQTISTIFGVLQMSHTRIFLHALKVMQRNASGKSNSKEWCGAVSTVDWGSWSHSSPRHQHQTTKRKVARLMSWLGTCGYWSQRCSESCLGLRAIWGHQLAKPFLPMTGNSEMCVKTAMQFNLCLTQQTNKKKEFGHKKQKNTKNNNKGLILLTVSKCSISCHSIASCGGNSVWNPSKIAICNAGAVHILTACLYTHKHTKEITGQPN